MDINEIENGIKVSVSFFFRQNILLNWNEIDSITIKKTNILRNFGGWGIRYTRNTTGFIFSGTNVASIKTKSGRNFSFTITKVNEFSSMLTLKHNLSVIVDNVSYT